MQPEQQNQQPYQPQQPPQQPQVPPPPQPTPPPPQFANPPQQPVPNFSQPVPSSSGGKSKKLIIIAAVLTLIVAASIIGAVKVFGNKTSKNKSLVGNQVTEEKSSKVGNPIKANGLTVNVESTEVKSKIGQYTKPKPGNEFVIAQVSITNNNNDSVDVSPLDFSASTPEGKGYPGESVYDASNTLETVSLDKGSTASGIVMFDVPKGKTQSVIYKYKYFPSDVAKDQVDYNFTFDLN